MYEIYPKKVIQEFKHPKNMGEIKDADGVGKVGNSICGDVMQIYIKVKKEKGKEIIKDVKVKTFGCVAAIATSSILTTLAKGKTIQEAEKIDRQDIVDALGGKLPPIKLHCSVLSSEALKAAIEDYKKRKKKL